jgi:hypothetical protein
VRVEILAAVRAVTTAAYEVFAFPNADNSPVFKFLPAVTAGITVSLT